MSEIADMHNAQCFSELRALYCALLLLLVVACNQAVMGAPRNATTTLAKNANIVCVTLLRILLYIYVQQTQPDSHATELAT